jgi:hypothetical protein
MAMQHAISKNDANYEIRRFLEIRSQVNQPNILNQLPEYARNYLSSQTLSFVFYKDQLDDLFAAVVANGFRVYFAAKQSGQPSLVIIPCSINADETSFENKQSGDDDGGIQYPGLRGTQYGFTDFDISEE